MTIIYTCTDKLDILTLRVSYHLKLKLKIRFVETNWPSNKEKTQLQQRTKFIWNNFARLEFIYWRFFDPNQGDNNLFCLPPTHNLEGTLFMQNRKIERRYVTGQLCTALQRSTHRFTFGALKDLGVNEEESPKLWHYVIRGASPTEAATKYTTNHFKVLLKETFSL